MSIGLIVAAGGSGSRFSTSSNKLLSHIHGLPIICHTLKKFLNIPEITHTVLVLPASEIQTFQSVIQQYRIPLPHIISGGDNRFSSVKLGLNSLPQEIQYVMVHDAARPLVSQQLIQRLIKEKEAHPAIIPAIPIIDTIKKVDPNQFVIHTVPRDEYRAIQTPQLFKKAPLSHYYQHTSYTSQITDDAMLCELNDLPIKVIDGETYNIKITTPNDLPILNALYMQVQ